MTLTESATAAGRVARDGVRVQAPGLALTGTEAVLRLESGLGRRQQCRSTQLRRQCSESPTAALAAARRPPPEARVQDTSESEPEPLAYTY